MFVVVYKTKTNNTYSFVAPVATRQEAVSDFSCFFNYQKDLKLVSVTPKI
jgi:protein involved in ribonucleotide reduction